MDIRKVHILIEQGLQQVGVFAYDDFTHEEIDLEIDASVYRIIKSAFTSIRLENQYQYNQGVLDRIRTLQSTEKPLTISSTEEDYVEFNLPEDYIHRIRVSARIAIPDQCSILKCNKIEVGKLYKLNNGKIRYNNEEYNSGDTFTGVEGVKQFEYYPDTNNVEIVEIKSKRVRCRVVESDKIDQILENSLSKTKASSPVTEITEEIVRAYFSDFVINNLIFSYIRTPSPVNFNFQRYSVGSTLIAGTKYEVISGTIILNDSTTYGAGQNFTLSANSSFTGTGVVKEYLDGDLVLPTPVCYDVINDVVQELSIKSEQSQQKIVNLAQKDNVPS